MRSATRQAAREKSAKWIMAQPFDGGHVAVRRLAASVSAPGPLAHRNLNRFLNEQEGLRFRGVRISATEGLLVQGQGGAKLSSRRSQRRRRRTGIRYSSA